MKTKLKLNPATGMAMGVIVAALISIVVQIATKDSSIWIWSIPIGIAAGLPILCDIYIKAIEDNQLNGAYNAVAPDHKTNKDFVETLAHVLLKPLWFPNIPAIVIKIIFGKMSAMLLKGSRVSSEKIINVGYKFKFPNLEGALVNLIVENTK